MMVLKFNHNYYRFYACALNNKIYALIVSSASKLILVKRQIKSFGTLITFRIQ